MIDEDTIGNWQKKFKASISLKDYLEENYISYSGKLTIEERELVKNYIKENIITDSKQVLSYIEEKFGKIYTAQGMQALLHKLGFSYQQLSLFPSKADLEKPRVLGV
jgi:transposase